MSIFIFGYGLSEKNLPSFTSSEGNFLGFFFQEFFTLCSIFHSKNCKFTPLCIHIFDSILFFDTFSSVKSITFSTNLCSQS